jgi:hypothetical protein
VQIVRTAIAIFLVSFILMGNTGLRVFRHACEEDGVFTSYIIPLEDHCEDHQEDLPVCCQKEKEKKDDCCSDEVDIYNVHFDYYQEYQVAIPFFVLPEEALFISLNETSTSVSTKEKKILRPPPLDKSGREILIFNQVFRI